MAELFQNELLQILTLALVVLGVVAAIVYRSIIRPRFEQTQFFERFGFVLALLDNVVTDVVLRLAFSKEDLSAFENRARETGRDARLVAAIYLIDRWSTNLGIRLDEEYVVSAIESKLAQLKDEGLIPYSSQAQTVNVNVNPDNPAPEDDDDDDTAELQLDDDWVFRNATISRNRPPLDKRYLTGE